MRSTFGKQVRQLKLDTVAWGEIRSLTPRRPQLQQALEALDAYFNVPRRMEIKAAMQSASGLTLSNTLAKKLFKVWMAVKWGDE